MMRRTLLLNAIGMTGASVVYGLVALSGRGLGWLLTGTVPLAVVHWVRWHRARR